MADKEQFFSIELKVSNRDDPLVQSFLQQFSAAMVREDCVIQGMPEIQVIACGWDSKCGAMTKCDAYEQELRDEFHEDPDDIIDEFLVNESKLY